MLDSLKLPAPDATSDAQQDPTDDLRAALQQRWESQLGRLLQPGSEQLKQAYEGGCSQCLEIGSSWVNLRMCLVCGQVGCCDSSPQTHARLHWQETGHAVIRTIEADEDWIFNFELNGYLS